MSRDSKAESGTDGTGSSKKAKRVSYEKQLDDVTKELKASKAGNGNGKSGKKIKLKPEQELILLEQKSILLLKLKRYKEVIDDGYSIVGRLGPNVTLFKCILIALVRLGKAEEEILELLEAWRKATPKCPHLTESKRKFDGYLAALRSGMKHTDIFSGIEDALVLNADSILSKQLSDVDESKWRFRAPPPRHTTFSICPRASSGSSCIYGDECLFAHSQEELKEWKLRGDADKKNSATMDDISSENGDRSAKKRPVPSIYRSLSIPPLCIHYLLDMGKRIKDTTDIQQILAPEIPSVSIRAGSPPKYQRRVDGISTIQCQWTFCVSSKMPMGTVSILHDANRELFAISSAHYYNKKKETIGLIELHPNNQVQTKLQVLNTFIQPSIFLRFNSGWPEMCFYKVEITFESRDPFPELGLYRQSVVFDFKKDPKVVKNICVEVLPKVEPIGAQLTPAPIKSPWSAPVNRVTDQLRDVCTLEPNLMSRESSPRLDPSHNDKLSNLSYKAVGFKNLGVVDSASGQQVKLNTTFSSGSYDSDDMKEDNLFMEGAELTKDNYRTWMHDFLDTEKSARHRGVKQIKTLMDVSFSNSYSPSTECLYKYNDYTGELYGRIETVSDVLLDSKLENIIMTSCTSVLICASTDAVTVSYVKTTPRYLCRIVEKSKSAIFIAIGKIAVDELLLLPDTLRQLHVQFVVDDFTTDRLKFCVDSLSKYHMRILFPQLENAALPFLKLPGLALMVSPEELFLNSRQQTVYNLITGINESEDDVFVPPILLTGGASTGKSHVMAHTLRGLLRTKIGLPPVRILICCQTDVAADVFITDYLHKWLVDDELSVQRSKPLRVYDTERFVDSVGGAVKHYCLFNYDGSSFRYPTKEEVLSHRIIIVTLTSCSVLLRLGLDSDTFSHIFIDEAANCLEVECIQPIALAGKPTRIVIAGDVFVTPLETFYPQAKVSPLSLLERLRNKYPFRHPFVINLVENYTSIEEILKFVSSSFYHDQLRSMAKEQRHPRHYPLGFHHISVSKELRADNGGGFYNMEEIRGILEFIDELLRSWPPEWGKPQDKEGIIVVTPYINHITGLRVQLQLKGLQWINVDSVRSLISKRFRVVIISTVRNHKFNSDSSPQISEDRHSGFFSNKWLVKLALSSAKSLVRVFGDLCSLIQHGECRNIWHKFAIECQSQNALLGFTVQEGLHLEKEPNSGYTSPVHREKTSPVLNSNSKMAANFDAISLNNTTMLYDSTKCEKKETQSKLNGILKLNDLNLSSHTVKDKSGNSSPWSSSPLSAAPKTDLFSAFSCDTKPLYSTSPLPPLNSFKGIPDSSKVTLSTGAVASNMINNLNQDAESFPALQSTSSPMPKFKLKPMVDIDGNAIDLEHIRPNSVPIKPLEKPFSDLVSLDLIEPKQMPLPEPTIPSQVLFDTKLVYGSENQIQLAQVVHSDSLGTAIDSPCPSPRKFISPLTRIPPGFPPIMYDCHVLNKGSYPSSPQKGYLSKTNLKRSTYELPPRMLKNMQVTSNPNKSPLRRQMFQIRPKTAAEMNFFEELGLDSQRGSGRSNSSASSDQSGMDPDETLCVVRKNSSSFSSESDWIEVKSSKKGKHQSERKSKERKIIAQQPSDDAEDVPAPSRPELCVDDKIDIIMEMGFSKSEAIKALQSCEKDLQRAVDWLISKPMSS